MEQTSISRLNDTFNEAEVVDKELFSEQRSNILLVSGDHYAKLLARTHSAIRTRSDIAPEQKVRLTKNHVQKIFKSYVNAITSAAPGVIAVPQNEKELKHKKAAQLRESVLVFAKRKYRMKEKIREYAESFCGPGETFVHVYWDPMAGDFIGYEQALDEQGIPMVGEDGSPEAGKTGVFSGDFVFENWASYNVLRSPNAKTLEESPYLIHRKMTPTKDLKARYKNDPEKHEKIVEGQDKTFVIFDAQTGSYSKSKDQTMVRTFLYRPCPMYPQGYYYIATEEVILEEGELPFGVWPVASTGFEKIQDSPRGRSPVKHMRPYQAEINRTASKIAETQITLGDDKIIMKGGTKLTQGALLPGIRGITVSGEDPKVLPGRDGAQYLPYMQATIAELYEVMGVQEISAEKNGNLDAYALLFRSASQKKVFSSNVERFEQFLIDLFTIFLKLAPEYYSDQMLIPMIGSNERVNLAELKAGESQGYYIQVESVSEDIESMLGKQLVMNQAMQYGAQQLGPEGMAKLIKNMPFLGKNDIFDDMTMNTDTADNVILALDRGEQPISNEFDKHPYIINRLTARMRQPDFKMLDPMVQQNYRTQVAMHEQMESAVQAKIMAAKSEYIPTGGAMVACDLYVQNPKDPLSQKRVRVPYEALNWLVQMIEKQGSSLDQLNSMSEQNQANIMGGASQQAHMMPPGQPNQPMGMPQKAPQQPGMMPRPNIGMPSGPGPQPMAPPSNLPQRPSLPPMHGAQPLR